MTIEIVDMHESHLDDVIKIEIETSATPWSADVFLKEMRSPTHILLVAKKDSDVVGFCGGQIVGDELHIHSLAVHEGTRRQGVGRELISSLLGKAKTVGVNKATLEVRVSNINAISLYESLDFKNEGLRKNYYRDNGEDAQIMWLNSIKVPRS